MGNKYKNIIWRAQGGLSRLPFPPIRSRFPSAFRAGAPPGGNFSSGQRSEGAGSSQGTPGHTRSGGHGTLVVAT